MLATKGISVLALDKDAVMGKSLTTEHPLISFLKCDLVSESEILQAVDWIDDQWHCWDILINNAGISRFLPLKDCNTSLWDEIIGVNLRASFILSREFSRLHQKCNKSRSYGRIVNISSTRAYMSEPGGEAYCASKGGLLSLTHALANSLANTGITVNCISPGWIHNGDDSELTENDHIQHPSGRVGTADDIARLVLYLCDERNDFINAEELRVDGGMTRKMIYQ